MSSKTPVKIILGTHTIGDVANYPGIQHFDSPEEVQALLDEFHSRGYRDIDTGRNYAGSEELLGQVGVASRFAVHTKVRDGPDGSHEAAKIERSIEQSLEALKTSAVETMYLHVPDRRTPFEETARAMDDAFRQGKFKKFGLSNFSAAEVQRYIEICGQKGYVKPSVYQGHYNAVVRGAEKELIPLLRKHNMAFYAYSPAAGGLFSGNAALFSSDAAGDAGSSARWSKDNMVGNLYSRVYGHPPIQAAVATVQAAAEKHGINGHAAALRWTAFHSILDGAYGDAVIFGVSKMGQLPKTLDALDAGPLPADLADAITAIYAAVEGVEIPYHL